MGERCCVCICTCAFHHISHGEGLFSPALSVAEVGCRVLGCGDAIQHSRCKQGPCPEKSLKRRQYYGLELPLDSNRNTAQHHLQRSVQGIEEASCRVWSLGSAAPGPCVVQASPACGLAGSLSACTGQGPRVTGSREYHAQQ